MLSDRYELLRRLGAGSMGVVWLAHDRVLDRPVALKELRRSAGMDDEGALERFLTEAQAAARLRHPSIVTVHDVFTSDDRVFMSLELLEGQTLAETIAAGPLGAAARPILRDVAEALAVAHSHGVVHRDLKPENVFLLPSGRVVVCDFGLARVGAGRGTQLGTVMGTPGYMAPEQIRGLDVGPSADVFAWGALAYELVSGKAPFGDPASMDLMAFAWRVANEEPVALLIQDDPSLWSVIAAALQKDPLRRPSTGEALLAALDSPPPNQVPPIQPESTPTPQRRSKALIAAIAAMAVVVAAVAGVIGVLLLTEPPVQDQLIQARPSDPTRVAAERDSESELTPSPVAAVPTAGPTPTPTREALEASEPVPLSTPDAQPPSVEGLGAGGSPDWGTFVIQVASRPKGSVGRADAEHEAASAYGYASPDLRVLDGDAYHPAMNPGYWVIYSGPYPSRTEAAAALARLQGALPSDVHVRHLDPSCPQAPCS